MNPMPIATAMLTRVKADTALWDTAGAGSWKAPILGGFWFGRGPVTLTRPYAVLSISMVQPENAYQGMGSAYEAEITIHDVRDEGDDRISYLIDRLIGNAMLASGTRTVPTYGFHNHELILPSNTLGMSGAAMTWLSSDFAAGDGTEEIVGRLRFGSTVSNLAVNQG